MKDSVPYKGAYRYKYRYKCARMVVVHLVVHLAAICCNAWGGRLSRRSPLEPGCFVEHGRMVPYSVEPGRTQAL